MSGLWGRYGDLDPLSLSLQGLLVEYTRQAVEVTPLEDKIGSV